MTSKTVLVLGGGGGGLVAANELRRLLPQEHRIVVIEKDLQHRFAPSFLWLMTGDRQPEQITRPLHKLVRTGVQVEQTEVRVIGVDKRWVETARQRLAYDYLIIALGAELVPGAIPGLDSAHTFYSFESALKLRDALQDFRGGVIAIVVGAVPYKCPGAPHEGAMLVSDFFRRRGLQGKVEIHLFTPEPQPMPVAGAVLGDAVKKMLELQGVQFHPQYIGLCQSANS